MLIFTKASLLAVWVREVLAEVKGQVVVWGNQANIKGSSDLYGVNFQIQFKITKIPSY
jgi:diphosphomevalonate decarboxylase